MTIAAAYYNEIDPFAAAWLRTLISAGHIAPGDVDERSIVDVRPSELRSYTQCHFFAGIGVWSYALRQAGWSDDRPVWTGSCPCQPFSAAGKGGGFADERHLWPAFHHLIAECGPATVLGEQVERKDGLAWLDLVQSDMEGVGYACGAVVTPSAGFGAPHERHRLYWVADADSERRRRQYTLLRSEDNGRITETTLPEVTRSGAAGGMEHTQGDGRIERRPEPGWRGAIGGRGVSGLDISTSSRRARFGNKPEHGEPLPPGPVNGQWGNADWLGCRDEHYRPVEPGTFPLAHGAPARVGRLRGYGNAINAEAAIAFIQSFQESETYYEGS